MKVDTYEDIISHKYTGRDDMNRLTMHKRAAQFAPFSALTGYKEMLSRVDEKVNTKYDNFYYEEEVEFP